MRGQWLLLAVLVMFCGCVHLLPTVTEVVLGSAADDSPKAFVPPKPVKANFRKRAVTSMEKQYDFDGNGWLNAFEMNQLKQAQAFKKYQRRFPSES